MTHQSEQLLENSLVEQITSLGYNYVIIKDVSKIGHHGLGSVEIRLKSYEDLEKAKPLIIKSYEKN